jgi:hypothetical protein
MFDEYDEGTAILPAVALKRNLPSGGEFIALDADGDLSLPSDWYLKIAGFAAEVMRGQRVLERTLPRKMLLGDYWGSRKHGPASGSSRPTATYVPNQMQAPVQQTSPSASASTDAATPTTSSWMDIAETKDDELPPPAYTLEAEEQVPTPSAITSSAPQPSPSAQQSTTAPTTAVTTGGNGPNRASTVHTSSPTVPTQGPAGLGRSSTYSVSFPTPTSSTQPPAPWAPPPHRFAPPPSPPPTSPAVIAPPVAAPQTPSPYPASINLGTPQHHSRPITPMSPPLPSSHMQPAFHINTAGSHNFAPPSTGATTIPSHPSSPYNPSMANLSSDFSRMSTGSPVPTQSSPPPNSGNQTSLPFNRPAEAVQTHQYAHYIPPQPSHQSEHAHSGSHGSPSLPTTGSPYSRPGWTAPVAAPSPPTGIHLLSNQYPSQHSSPASQTQQWGQPSGPPSSSSSVAYMGNLGVSLSTHSSPHQSPSSYPGMSSQSQPVHPDHGLSPSNPTSYPSMQSPWHPPQHSTSNYPGMQQQYLPANLAGTAYGDQPQVGYYSGYASTPYTPLPGPPQPPKHPGTSGASGSGGGPQGYPDVHHPSHPNNRTSLLYLRVQFSSVMAHRADSSF